MTTEATPQVDAEDRATLGAAVSVGFFTGKHVVKSTLAHVIAVGPVDAATGHPTVTVAYPKAADEAGTVARQLSGASWHQAYERQTGVQHYSHPDVRSGKLSIAYANEDEHPTEALVPQPAGSGDNPIFDRHIIDPAAPKVTEAIAAQQGKVPEGSHVSPVASEAGTVHDATVAATAEAPAHVPATAEQVRATETSTTAATDAPAPKETEGQVLQNLADAVEGKKKKS